ncbi:MAG: DUF4294 domain-containing protein [Tannerellaceae bacterium]|jgi:hypothetical protein|nr:DUF4294 domain-containing protein [Tannerellaceae bacterium]
MKRPKLFWVIGLLCAFAAVEVAAQDIVLPPGLLPAEVIGMDTVPLVRIRTITVYPQLTFRNKRERRRYDKLVRDVKITLPYAKLVYNTLIETYEYMETLPDDKARQDHLKRMEKDLFAQYMPELKRLSLSQGKLLIRLIDRECNQTSYNLLKAYLGSFRAGFWNFFAGMFGASLKSDYNPQGKDALTERIVVLVESGVL